MKLDLPRLVPRLTATSSDSLRPEAQLVARPLLTPGHMLEAPATVSNEENNLDRVAKPCCAISTNRQNPPICKPPLYIAVTFEPIMRL